MDRITIPNRNLAVPRVPNRAPVPQGLYDPFFEHDACGIGFVAHIKGKPSHEIVQKALQILINLRHRGACGCETNTGDGAGVLIQIPHKFFQQACADAGIALPQPRWYGVGNVFLPRDPVYARKCENELAEIVREEGQRLLGWRTVPVDNSCLGETARSSEPFIRQVFIERSPDCETDMDFERKLYVIRRRAEKALRYSRNRTTRDFYVCSLSHKTLVYKGMLTAEQIQSYYPDLSDSSMESALAIVHSRFSTNTFPSWERAHPYRYICHNGEINTLRGNVNWMEARQALFESDLFGPDIAKVLPVLCYDGSDSAMLDNCLEFLVLAGRSVPEAIMMMIPEPWEKHQSMRSEKRAFYKFHSCLMEPWDGPAAIAFTDGVIIGAVLDRNGLRPGRYYVTRDDLVIMASEVGVLNVPEDKVLAKDRLRPGRMLLVDTSRQVVLTDDEVKLNVATARPYELWLREHMSHLRDLPPGPTPPKPDTHTLRQLQRAFGYTFEEEQVILLPMAKEGAEPLGSMGTDTPLAVLSDRPQLLYNYFKQLFAQVTNPPIDSIREKIVTSTYVFLGAQRNLLVPEPRSCQMIQLESPVITNEELAKLKYITRPPFRAATIPILFKVNHGGAGLEKSLEELFAQAEKEIRNGANILILSDRDLTRGLAPIPALLAVAGLHHHLIKVGLRAKASLVLESGEPREVHHFALLVGYGCNAISPYLAFETIQYMVEQKLLDGIGIQTASKNYVKAVVDGIVKVMSKMGISTLQSYHGAQIFEAVGLGTYLVQRYFPGTPSRIEGIGLEAIAREVQIRMDRAYAASEPDARELEPGGQYKFRNQGEHHLLNPSTVHKLRLACRTGDYELFKEYSNELNADNRRICTIRGLLGFRYAPHKIPLEEVEPVEEIVKRFKTSAMSYGSISEEAHKALALAMNSIGGKSNSGEGGEDMERYTGTENGISLNSAIKQVASGRFGVTSLYLVNANEIQIKIAQGAKPGEGGQLPGHKVYPWIARVRYSTPGVGLISPPPHHDIYSIEDLEELIYDLRSVNPGARISVKLVSEVGVGTIAAGVAKARADAVLISGYDGGTGAAPLTSIKHAGLPWELGLAETHQTLLLNNLRNRIIVETDGKLLTGRDVVIAALLGAEEFGFATGPLIALGCVMMRACHLNTCPVGIATQDPQLRKLFDGKPEYVVNFMRFVAQEVREIMAQLGFRRFSDMVGRVDRLEPRRQMQHWKAKDLDLSKLLYRPDAVPAISNNCGIPQDQDVEKSIDKRLLLKLCAPAIKNREPVRATLMIRNVNRATGALLGGEISKRYGAAGLPDDTIRLKFKGSAGQSFGAFIPRGVTFVLEGDANDYVGKGLSGGRIIVYPPKQSPFRPDQSVVIGNVAFYGGTSGEAYINGVAGERFCVRNSGVHAVVEAVGDHGCEYMTGGRVIILGKTGRNFAAGMTGGIAYVLDPDSNFAAMCNTQTVTLERLQEEEEIEFVRQMIQKHSEFTGSIRAAELLEHWPQCVPLFVKVMPNDYKKVLESLQKVTHKGADDEDALMAAFTENANVVAHLSTR